MPRLYLAGPEVFLEDAADLAEARLELCRQYGFEGVLASETWLGDLAQPSALFAGICRLIRDSDGLIANLTPFRGPSADVGTVFELGYAAGLGKPVFGYTADLRDLQDRVRASDPAARFDPGRGAWVDALNMEIEGFGGADNLMLDEALTAFGRPIFRFGGEAAGPFRDLTGLEHCLRLAQDWFGKDSVDVDR